MITFALPSHGFDYDVKRFTKQVKTLKWCNTYKRYLSKYADKLTSSNRDDLQIIGGMLQAAYGVNIGSQVEANLKPEDLVKIRLNILKTVF